VGERAADHSAADQRNLGVCHGTVLPDLELLKTSRKDLTRDWPRGKPNNDMAVRHRALDWHRKN
jgi:hypothetical protein